MLNLKEERKGVDLGRLRYSMFWNKKLDKCIADNDKLSMRLSEVEDRIRNLVSCETCGCVGDSSNFVKGNSIIEKDYWGYEYIKKIYYCNSHFPQTIKSERKK